VSIFEDVRGRLRRWYHTREIEASLRHYGERTGRDAESRVAFAETGSFRSQVDRLFLLGSSGETDALRAIASSVVSVCLANKYYRPADFLSDIVDALESWTFLSGEPGGEPGLEGLDEHARRAKLKTVMEAWLVPIKVAALESLLAGYVKIVGKTLPYASLGRFERQAARVFALLEQSEVSFAEKGLRDFVGEWCASEELKARFQEPGDGIREVVECLEGFVRPEGTSELQVRTVHQPFRLSTVVPYQRQHLLDATLARLAAEGGTASGSGGAAPRASRGAQDVAGAGAAATEIAAGPTRASEPADGEEVGGTLSIVLDCPKCGASFSADDETVSFECDYCGSLLILAAPERVEIYLELGRIQDSQELLELVIDYRVTAHRAEIISGLRSGEELEGPPEWLIQRQLRAFERELRKTSRLLEAHQIQAPYWHITGKIVQGALGRWKSSPKLMRVRGLGVEHTRPGYDEGRANLRDRGLRLRRSQVRPLTVKEVERLRAFVPWVEVGEQSHREIAKWLRQDLEPGFEPIVKHGEFLFSRRILVYRSYWLAYVVADRGPEWVLVDGAFRTIAGYPDAHEARALLEQATGDPLGSGEESFRHVHVVAARCPDCGFEGRTDRRYHLAVCTNCHRGLQRLPDGIQLFSYDHAAGEGSRDGDYLPFWRYRFVVRSKDAESTVELEAYARLVFPEGLPPGFSVKGDALWVPAFRLLGTQLGDECFKSLCEWLHRNPPPVTRAKVPLGGRVQLWGVSLPEAEARSLGRLVLMGLHGKASAARLNTLLVRRVIENIELDLADPRLVLVRFDRADEELFVEGTDVQVPLLLLEGGPQLERLRETVHRRPAPR